MTHKIYEMPVVDDYVHYLKKVELANGRPMEKILRSKQPDKLGT